ncbi:ATP-dependent bile acid permease [Apiospora arundinis]
MMGFVHAATGNSSEGDSDNSSSISADAPVSRAGAASPWIQPFRHRSSSTPYYVDQRLDDPDRLARHIQHWADTPPQPWLTILGTHTETYTTYTTYSTYHAAGNYCTTTTVPQTQTRTVTDFEIRIDLTPYFYMKGKRHNPWVQLSFVPEPTYREMVKKKVENRKNKNAPDEPPLKTLQQWCERFCADESRLKRFALRRETTGFNLQFLRKRLTSLVRETGYNNHVEVYMCDKNTAVKVYNGERENRWRLKPWVKFLFGVTFLWTIAQPYLSLRTVDFGTIWAYWPFSRQHGSGREYVQTSEEGWYNTWAPAIRKAILERNKGVLKSPK